MICPDCGGQSARFDFLEPYEGVSGRVPSVSPAQQKSFMDVFCQAARKLDDWTAKVGWNPIQHLANLRVFVSWKYPFARSLVPQWTGDPGRMEFPAFRVAVGEAGALHELVHIYFPNANRMLAEGFAVYLQQKIGNTSAFPNFGRDLRQMMKCELTGDLGGDLEDIDLVAIDQITTPSSLEMRYGLETINEAGWVYVIVGSFVQFLLDDFGKSDGLDDAARLKKFRALYQKTPLVPLRRDAGSFDRWKDVYGVALPELEKRWRSWIERGPKCP
jgi:hypothetical protein